MIVVGSMAVVRHADDLAEMLGEPYGTLILTLSVATIEIVTIGIVMTTGRPESGARARHDVLGRHARAERAHRRSR